MAATLERVDADHDWALWHEKWIAALDLMGSQSDRATKAEAKLAEAEAAVVALRAAWKASDAAYGGELTATKTEVEELERERTEWIVLLTGTQRKERELWAEVERLKSLVVSLGGQP